QARLDQVLDRYREVEARMSAVNDGAEIVRLAKEHSQLKAVAEAAAQLARLRAERSDLEAMARGEDPEMAELARQDLAGLEARLPAMERDLALLLAPGDADEDASAILEVRAGT